MTLPQGDMEENTKRKFVAYFRVSTQKQGRSGLGLDAQISSVLNYAKNGEVIGEFTDVESGGNNERPELKKAIELAKKEGASLVIAKLDRLSRNLMFISALMDSKVKFVCVDMPDANEFTIHIFAALAQQERKMISERTKSALASAKAKGTKLGTPENFSVEGRRKGNEIMKIKARNNLNNKRAVGYIRLLRDREGLTYHQIANKLNEEGYLTSRGKLFYPATVLRLYNKINL